METPQWSLGHQNTRSPTKRVTNLFHIHYLLTTKSGPPKQPHGPVETGVKTWKLHGQPSPGCCLSFPDDGGHVSSPLLQQVLFFVACTWSVNSGVLCQLTDLVYTDVCLYVSRKAGAGMEPRTFYKWGVCANNCCSNMPPNTQENTWALATLQKHLYSCLTTI